MRIKRIFAALLIALMMFSLMAFASAAEGADSLDISAEVSSDASAVLSDGIFINKQDGLTIQVTLKINSNPGISAVMGDLSFDPEVLEYKEFTKGSVFTGEKDAYSITGDNEAGTVKVLIASAASTENNVTTGALVTLEFLVKGSVDGAFVPVTIASDFGAMAFNEQFVKVQPILTQCKEIKAHHYVAVEGGVQAPTCSNPGTVAYKCSVCDEEYTVTTDAALPHTPVVDAAVPPTCVDTGLTEGSHCSVCNVVLVAQEVLPADGGHTPVVDAAVEPTCTATGLTEGSHCSKCNEVLVAQEIISEKGHKMGDWELTTEPTCVDKGVETKTCSVCGATETQDVAPNGHKHVGKVTDPTCTEDGFTTYTCKVCGDTYTDDIVTAPGHKYEDKGYAERPTCTDDGVKKEVCSVCGDVKYTAVTALGHVPADANQKDPTCTETGLTAGSYCTVCNEKLTQEVIPALGHDYAAVVTAPTCVDKGYTTHTCSRCQNTYTDSEVAALGHDLGEWQLTTEPTCTVKGVETKYCKVCDYSETQSVAELGHAYVAVVTAPTCLDKGYTTHTCSRCQDTYTDSEVAALGHDYVAVVTAPTCLDKGYTTHTCSRCQDTYTDSEVAALGHSFGAWVVTTEPTCLAEGVETKTCTVCQHAETQPVAALGHDYVAVVTAPTCLDKGYTTHTCSRCEDTYTDTEVDALGHDLGDWTLTTEPTCTAKGVETKYCSRCDYTETQDVAMLEHAWGDWVQTTAPTTTSKGENTSTCADCGATKTEPVSKLPVMTFTPEEWKKGEGLTFISDAEFENFVKVTINGEELAKEHYTVSEGSTVVVLNDEYLETLEAGEYTIAIESTTGTAEATFEIASNVWWIVLIVVAAVLLCGGGAVAVVIFLRKERNAA